MMRKDFSLIMRMAAELSVPMPATAAAEQMYAARSSTGTQRGLLGHAPIYGTTERLTNQ